MQGSNAVVSHSAAFGSPAQISDHLISMCVGEKTRSEPLVRSPREGGGRKATPGTDPALDGATAGRHVPPAQVLPTLRSQRHRAGEQPCLLLSAGLLMKPQGKAQPFLPARPCGLWPNAPSVGCPPRCPTFALYAQHWPCPNVFNVEKETPYFPLSHLKSSRKSMAGG